MEGMCGNDRGVKVKNLDTEKNKRGDRYGIAMSVQNVIESPEDHEERLTRRGQGLEGIKANYRWRESGREKHRQMGQAEGQRDGKGKERVTVVDSPTDDSPG